MTDAPNVSALCTQPAESVGPGSPLRTVVQVLSNNEIGVVLVVDDGPVVGVVSERDVVRGLMLHDELGLDGDVLDRVAGDLMSTPVVAADPTASVADVRALMAAEQVRHVVVTERDRHFVISLRDLV